MSKLRAEDFGAIDVLQVGSAATDLQNVDLLQNGGAQAHKLGAASPRALLSGWSLTRWYLTELPQGRNAARAGELFQVREGSSHPRSQPVGDRY